MTGRVVVNGRCLLRPVTGVERYARQVLRHLPGPATVLKPGPSGTSVRGHWWEQVSLPRMLDRDDLLWLPANTGPLAVSGHVLSLHDASFLDHPSWFHPAVALWYRALIPALARRASLVITDSEFSKSRLVARLALPAGRVRVVQPGVDVDRFRRPPEDEIERTLVRHGLDRPYFIFVGPAGRRKSYETLAGAWRMMPTTGKSLWLALAGESGPTFPGAGPGSKPALVRHLGRVGDDELAALYAGSLGLVHPSHYEGFGLPCLEALACGARVLAADTPVAREVLGSCARYFPATDQAKLADLLGQVAAEGQPSTGERRHGREFARAYPWQRTAEGVWRVLAEARLAGRAEREW